MTKPLAIDLFCGLGGWTEALLEEGYDVVGFDIERHVYGQYRYPAQLVIQDVRTLHGSQFRNAALVVASPPCQEFSYMSMPWSLAKAKAAEIRADKTGAELERLTELFHACFRIQREACEAAGSHIPLVIENVRGAQPWVGRARWAFGSYFLWGDVPALMPTQARLGIKGSGGGKDGWFGQYDGVKQGGDWFNSSQPYIARRSSSKSKARKKASAMIAKIPQPLARHIAAVYFPREAVDKVDGSEAAE